LPSDAVRAYVIPLILLVALLPSAAVTSGDPLPLRKGESKTADASVVASWDHYKDYWELTDLLQRLNCTFPSLADLRSIGKSVQGRELWVIRLTNENLTWTRPRVLFVGYHHAREFISAEVPLYIAWHLLNNYAKNETIRGLLDSRELYIIPAVNPDGFAAATANNWHRKNLQPIDDDDDGRIDEDPPDDENGNGEIEILAREDGSFVRYEGKDDDGDDQYNEDWPGGVDLNRNYAYGWGDPDVVSGSTNPFNEDYIGASSFSEPETRSLRDFVLQTKPAIAISYHSGTSLILYPWGYTFRSAPHREILRWIAERMRDSLRYPARQSSNLYTTSGSWDDWMYAEGGTLSFTIEVYGDDSSFRTVPAGEGLVWLGGIGAFFNPRRRRSRSLPGGSFPAFSLWVGTRS